MNGDADGQVWLTSSDEIAGLEPAAGATRFCGEGEPKIDALLEVDVDAEQLYWGETRSGEDGRVGAFYLLDDGGTLRG